MRVEILCLCKAVSINQYNEPTLTDIFDKKIAAGQPVLIDPFVLAASIRFFKEEIGEHRFQVSVRDGVGNLLMEQTEIVSFKEITEPSTTYFIQAHFPHRISPFGEYWFSIESQGKPLAKTPLYVSLDRRKTS
jgi:hypothetical protein